VNRNLPPFGGWTGHQGLNVGWASGPNRIRNSVLRHLPKRGLLPDELFGFRLRHSTTLELARHFEGVNRNFDERRLTGAVCLDVAEAFDTVMVGGLLFKITILNFPSHLVKTFSHMFNAEHSKRLCSQPQLQEVPCGLVWAKVDLFPLSSSDSM
jgi:hypothetical protein